jgi:hypothetical protein
MTNEDISRTTGVSGRQCVASRTQQWLRLLEHTTNGKCLTYGPPDPGESPAFSSPRHNETAEQNVNKGRSLHLVLRRTRVIHLTARTPTCKLRGKMFDRETLNPKTLIPHSNVGCDPNPGYV